MIKIGQIKRAYGIKGLVKVASFADPMDNFFTYQPVYDQDGHPHQLEAIRFHKGQFVCRIDGITRRSDAERLCGLVLFITRDQLPPPEDEDTFYHTDLVGLSVETIDGRPLGTVVSIADFGAGSLLEIKLFSGQKTYCPFTRAAVPEIEHAQQKIRIDPQAAGLEQDS